jgi:ankyrin repeat protein
MQRTLLFYTTDVTIAQLLVEKGADIKHQDKYGLTPMHFAATKSGSKDYIAFLLAAGADVGKQDADAKTPLHYAHDPTVADFLLESKADAYVNTPSLEEGMTCLHLAVSGKRTALVQLLLANPLTDIHAQNLAGRTVLHLAAAKGYTDLLKLLVTHTGKDQAFCTAVDAAGWTALHFACLGAWPQYESHISAATYLIDECGVDVNAKDLASGWTALHSCTDSTGSELLIARGADVSVADESGRTPLHMCGQDTTPLLVEAKASVHAVDRFKRTPLHMAASADKVDWLIRLGADPAATDVDGRTALECAQVSHRQDVVRYVQ